MAEEKKRRDEGCCGPEGMKRGGMMHAMMCCNIEAVVTVDERGQIVLPKDVREKAGIKAGDKLAVLVHGSSEHFCCVNLIKAEGLAESVKKMLGPMMKELFE